MTKTMQSAVTREVGERGRRNGVHNNCRCRHVAQTSPSPSSCQELDIFSVSRVNYVCRFPFYLAISNNAVLLSRARC